MKAYDWKEMKEGCCQLVTTMVLNWNLYSFHTSISHDDCPQLEPIAAAVLYAILGIRGKEESYLSVSAVSSVSAVETGSQCKLICLKVLLMDPQGEIIPP